MHAHTYLKQTLTINILHISLPELVRTNKCKVLICVCVIIYIYNKIFIIYIYVYLSWGFLDTKLYFVVLDIVPFFLRLAARIIPKRSDSCNILCTSLGVYVSP